MRHRHAVLVAALCVCQLVVAASTASADAPAGTAGGKGKATPTLSLKTLVATGGDVRRLDRRAADCEQVVAVFAFSLLFALVRRAIETTR